MNIRLQNRRGVTLILTVGFIVIFMGCAALAIDVSRLYVYHGQLQRAADASALAGAVGLGLGEGSNVPNSAIAWDHLNKVGDSTNTLVSDDVTPGNYVISTGVFSPTGSWTSSNTNAVQTVTRFPANFTFGRFFNFTSKNMTATAIAVHGSVGTDHCIRPWAVSYRDLLDHLDPTLPITHDLTSAEVIKLAKATLADTLVLNQPGTAQGQQIEGAPHEMRAVSFPPMEFATAPYHSVNPDPPSADTYSTEISEDCSLVSGSDGSRGISVGDYLQGASGQMTGKTGEGITNLLCTGTGKNQICQPSAAVDVAIWDTYGPSPQGWCGTGTSGCYHVKYLGVFNVTGWDGPPNNNVKGYFGALGSPYGGGLSTAPGPITKNGLVR